MQVPALRDLEVGAAFTAGRVPEGLNSLRAETIPGDTLVDRVYVNGLRRRLGAELLWRPGPLSVQGEVIRVSEERRGQGIDNENLPDAVQRGWYLSGSWLITGEEKKNNVEPAAPIQQQRQAVESQTQQQRAAPAVSEPCHHRGQEPRLLTRAKSTPGAARHDALGAAHRSGWQTTPARGEVWNMRSARRYSQREVNP